MSLGSVLVIGGCGLLGHHIVKYLLESGEATSITVFDISTKFNRYPGVHYINGSIASIEDISSALKESKAETIFNTASPDPLTASKRMLENVNIVGTQNVLDCAMEYGIKVLVHTSSSEVVQNSYDDMIWIKESSPLPESPVDGSVYAKTKQVGENLVLKANGTNGLLTVAIRLCTIFGEGDRILMPHIVELARSGRARYHIGTGKNLYDFIYAGNAAEGHVLAAGKLVDASLSQGAKRKNKVDGEAFFMTNGDPWPFWDFSRSVAREIGRPIADKEIWRIPLVLVYFFLSIFEWVYWVVTMGGQPRVTYRMLRYTVQVRTFDITKAKERLGYRPRISMEEGLRRTVSCHIASSVTNDNSRSLYAS
ncbi:putative sterol-4-alpha-carboxylate 3-dehydrogenase, decarboxylating [Patellaria atrata CBS 101060]|uniref:Sterol-4-alpha-carboxylate 3-dehydrogenase, decarboxylating n=1 Tax=Patellaria atrata CBS 101060 TaxID=1346257 RepID=A0A9P4S7Q7_9PEZI|nr:putative sterol-4-alpha-carboxylate 3-dehydrogenase, decarboxylating [Patellaria atrata CBS 101060]